MIIDYSCPSILLTHTSSVISSFLFNMELQTPYSFSPYTSILLDLFFPRMFAFNKAFSPNNSALYYFEKDLRCAAVSHKQYKEWPQHPLKPD